jgi:phosphotransferase system HPr (HPr) family protein
MNLLKEPLPSIKVPVKIKYELRGRYSAVFVGIANLFKSTQIYLANTYIKINAKSIISILHLCPQPGDILFIEAKGKEAQLAITSLAKALSESTGQLAKEILARLKKDLP